MAEQLALFDTENIRDPAPGYRELGKRSAERALRVRGGVFPRFPAGAERMATIHGVAFPRDRIEKISRQSY